MKRPFLKFAASVILPLVLSIVLSLSFNYFQFLPSLHWYYGIWFFGSMSLIFNSIYWYRSRYDEFTQLLLVCIVIKLLLALIAILSYSFIDKAGFFNFAIHFILYYVLFSIFEIRYLLALIKTNSPNTISHEN